MFSRKDLLALHVQHKHEFVTALLDEMTADIVKEAKEGMKHCTFSQPEIESLRKTRPSLRPFHCFATPSPKHLVRALKKRRFPDCDIQETHFTSLRTWNITIYWEDDEEEVGKGAGFKNE